MATDYAIGGQRIAKDHVSPITWEAICDTDVTDWSTTDQAIISVNHFTQTHTPVA